MCLPRDNCRESEASERLWMTFGRRAQAARYVRQPCSWLVLLPLPASADPALPVLQQAAARLAMDEVDVLRARCSQAVASGRAGRSPGADPPALSRAAVQRAAAGRRRGAPLYL